jgi:predicted RNA binding protein YcfA (HicA-like mRNA interferase family)
LAKALRRLGYIVTRQNGSHLRVTTLQGGEHHEVIPNHSPIKIGTFKSILRNVAAHHRMSVGEVLRRLDL